MDDWNASVMIVFYLAPIIRIIVSWEATTVNTMCTVLVSRR